MAKLIYTMNFEIQNFVQNFRKILILYIWEKSAKAFGFYGFRIFRKICFYSNLRKLIFSRYAPIKFDNNLILV